MEGGARFSVLDGATLNTVATPQVHNTGQILVQNGATWNNTGTGNEIRIGYAGGTSSLNVFGATVNTGGLRLGHNFAQSQGHGSLTITNNGIVNATTLTLDDTSGAAIRVSENGALNVGAISETQPGSVVNLGNGGTLAVNGGGNSTFGGTLQDLAGASSVGALTKAGAGTLVFTRASAGFSGNVNLNGGSLGVGSNAALGTGTINAGGGALYASGADRTLANAVSVAGGNTLNVVSVAADLHNLTLTGAVTGAGVLSVNAPGATVTLGGGGAANTFSGLTSVTAGTLLLNKSAGVALSSALAIGNATNPGTPASAVVRLANDYQTVYNATVSVFSDGQFDVNSRRASIGALNLTGGLVSIGAGVLTLDGDVTVNASAAGARITSLDFSDDVGLGNATSTFTVARGAATYDLDVQAGVGAGSLVKAGPGTLRLAGQGNSYLAVTLNAGTLAVAADDALGSNGGTFTLAGGTVVADGGNRTISNPLNVTGNATVGSSVDGTPRSLTFTGAASLGAGATLTVSNNATTTFSGVVSGAGGLLRTGNGTLALTNTANTFSGGLTLDGGTLQVAADGSFGAAGNVVALNAGTLAFASSFTTARTLLLSNAFTLSPGAGNTLTYASGATVNGGNLGASGTHAFTDGSTLNGTTALIGSTLTQSGTVAFNNATVRGTFTQVAGATLNAVNGLNVSGSGLVTANGTVNLANGGESLGRIAVNPGATVNVGGNALYLDAGSRTTIGSVGAPGGTLAAANGASVELAGLLVNNGAQTGTLNVNYGGTAKGSGSFGTVNVTSGGVFSPGNSPGTATVNSLNLESAGKYQFELSSATAANNSPGNSADLIGVSQILTISAGTTANSRFTVAIVSLDGNDNAAALTDFDPSKSYRFVLATSGGIVGYNAGEFAVDTTGFANNLAGGSFSVVQDGSNLDLVFSPATVPEPNTWALLSLGGAGLLGLTLRQRRCACLG